MIDGSWASSIYHSIKMAFVPRLLVLALLPVVLLLGAQIGYRPLGHALQAQTLLSSWLPPSLQDVVLLNRPRVKVRQGTVVGTTFRDGLPQPVEVFRGIPYALPPVGDRRFRRAQPIPDSDNTIDASQFGPRYGYNSFIE